MLARVILRALRVTSNSIRAENAFARGRSTTRSAKLGPAPYASTLAAAHVISEAASIHQAALKANAPPDAPAEEPPWLHRFVYHAYLSSLPTAEEHAVIGKGPGEYWQNMSDFEKAEYVHMWQAAKDNRAEWENGQMNQRKQAQQVVVPESTL